MHLGQATCAWHQNTQHVWTQDALSSSGSETVRNVRRGSSSEISLAWFNGVWWTGTDTGARVVAAGAAVVGAAVTGTAVVGAAVVGAAVTGTAVVGAAVVGAAVTGTAVVGAAVVGAAVTGTAVVGAAAWSPMCEGDVRGLAQTPGPQFVVGGRSWSECTQCGLACFCGGCNGSFRRGSGNSWHLCGHGSATCGRRRRS